MAFFAALRGAIPGLFPGKIRQELDGFRDNDIAQALGLLLIRWLHLA